MNCTDFNKLFDDYVDRNEAGLLSPAQIASADAHLATCPVCSASIKAHQEMMGGLRQMPVIGPSAGFEERVLRMAVPGNSYQHHRRGFVAGFGSAVAAGLALWLVAGWLPNESPTTNLTAALPETAPIASQVTETFEPIPAPQQIAAATPVKPAASRTITATKPLATTNPVDTTQELSISLREQHDIKLAFHSGKALQGAKITIQLPDNVVMVGYPDRHELSWETSLKEGENLLRLPIMATQAMQGELVVRIEHGNKVKQLLINLKTRSPGLGNQSPVIDPLV